MAIGPPRRPPPDSAAAVPGPRKVARLEAGRYLGCPSCGRLLRIEWAVRSLVCSCGARVPVSPPAGTGS